MEYEKFVTQAKDMPKREDLTGGGLIRSAGGWSGLMDLRRSKERWMADERILGDGDFVDRVLNTVDERVNRKEQLQREGWNQEKLVKRVCQLTGITNKEIYRYSKNSKIAEARKLLTYWGNKELGMSGMELAKMLGITRSAVSQSIKQGEAIAAKHGQYLHA